MKPRVLILMCISMATLFSACQRSRFTQTIPKATFAMGQCDGPDAKAALGTFDVQLQPTKDPNLFSLLLFPIEVFRQGETINISVINRETLEYQELIQAILLRARSTIKAGILSRDDLDKYDVLSIAQYVPGVAPVDAKPNYYNFCALLLPGQGVSGY